MCLSLREIQTKEGKQRVPTTSIIITIFFILAIVFAWISIYNTQHKELSDDDKDYEDYLCEYEEEDNDNQEEI